MSTEVIVLDNSTTEVTVISDSIVEIISAAVQGPPGTSGITNISDATDVDLSNLADGSLLIYSTVASTWQAKNILEKQVVDCGQF